MKCDKCRHKGICKYEDNMKKFDEEIKEKSKLLEYQTFQADIRCEHFTDGKINFPAGVR